MQIKAKVKEAKIFIKSNLKPEKWYFNGSTGYRTWAASYSFYGREDLYKEIANNNLKLNWSVKVEINDLETDSEYWFEFSSDNIGIYEPLDYSDGTIVFSYSSPERYYNKKDNQIKLVETLVEEYKYLAALNLISLSGALNEDIVDEFTEKLFPDWAKGFIAPAEEFLIGKTEVFFNHIINELMSRGYMFIEPVNVEISNISVVDDNQIEVSNEDVLKIKDSFKSFVEKELYIVIGRLIGEDQANDILKTLPKNIIE